ncbi:MAG: toxin-antitoxin (TA) system antitoxin [Leptolyngbya foveolarum]|uniref:Toxin-antitoxin (TA) system antitoxin n=1 Tax=Leptolyngbya foveolarum TaxID=47253 RepID=A0A2W4U5F2_9CYAN|nr:MAG: toxin-antitoxin (TA) system antitoxin [Leptolyngbya foveolarum]
MTTQKIDIQSVFPTLQELLVAVKEGTEVLLTEGDIPLARLTPVEPPSTRTAGLHQGAIQMSDDFDAPLPDSFWLGDE